MACSCRALDTKWLKSSCMLQKNRSWTPRQSRILVAVGALDAILVLANQTQKVPQNWPLILRIPYDRESHVEVLRNQRRDDHTRRSEIANAGGDQSNALAGLDQRKHAGPGRRRVDDVRREAGSRAKCDDAIKKRWRQMAIA